MILRLESTQKQIFKRQLRIVSLQVMRRGCTRDLQSFTHGIEMKSDNARRQPD